MGRGVNTGALSPVGGIGEIRMRANLRKIGLDGSCQNKRKSSIFKEPDGSIHDVDAFSKVPVKKFLFATRTWTEKVRVLSPAWYRAAVEFQGRPEQERLAFCSWCCCHGGCNLCMDISKYNIKGLKIYNHLSVLTINNVYLI